MTMNNVQVVDSLEVHPNFHLARAWLVLVGLIALLGLLYLTQSTQATLTGKRLVSLQERLEELRRENAQLEYEIGVLTAPQRLAERATRLGLRPLTPAQARYVVIKDFAPLPPAMPPASVRNAPQPSSTFDLVWRELMLRLGWHTSEPSAAASP
jgi:hypothetical protein